MNLAGVRQTLASRHQPIVRRARQGRGNLGGKQESLRPPRAGSSLSHPGQHPDSRTRVFHQRPDAGARETSLSTELHSLRDLHERIEGDLDIARAAQNAAEKISEQAQKGEAVGQLLAGVVHDLNNVLGRPPHRRSIWSCSARRSTRTTSSC